jgi:hypothetical protein
MTATPPEAKPEYSRALRQSKPPAPIARGLLAGGLLGGLPLLVAELTPLYRETSSASRHALRTVQTGSHHAYALVPVALLAIVLAVGAARTASRPALAALGALGILALLIALLGDLPDANATGFARVATVGFVRAKDVPQIGFYLESLGAVLLVITGVGGLFLVSSRTTTE